MMQAGSRFRRHGKLYDQSSASAARRRRKPIAIAAVVTNVIAAVDWCNDSTESLFLNRTKKIARIDSAVQARLCHARRIKAALEGKTTFFWRVVKGADDEIFAGVTLRTTGEFFIFVGRTLHHFRPRNISAGERQD